MKKALLLSILFLWAGVTIASELPPYSELYSFGSLFVQQTLQQPDKEIQIYPNPVTDGRLTIKSGESFHLIQILNITGEIVFSQEYPSGTNSEVIELTNLEKGMYLIRIGFAGKTNHTAKIIIK
jgi:hypothetical protein